MSRFQPSKADSAFLAILSGDSITKEAVELDPSTRALLGVDNSPDDLDQLEWGASRVAANEPPPNTHEVGPLSPIDVEAQPQPEEFTAPPPPPPIPTRATHGKIFNARRTHPLDLLDVLMAKYKKQWLEWEPETLWWAIRRDFGPVGEITQNKIDALRAAIETTKPWDDWDIFENCSLAWNDLMPLFGVYQPMTPSQTAYGVQILQTLRPGQEFSDEVKAYIAAVLDEAGMAYAPAEWFDGAQDIISRKGWLLPFKVRVEQVWQAAKTVDPSAIEWREEDPVDVHVARLLVVQNYLTERAATRIPAPVVERAPAEQTMA